MSVFVLMFILNQNINKTKIETLTEFCFENKGCSTCLNHCFYIRGSRYLDCTLPKDFDTACFASNDWKMSSLVAKGKTRYAQVLIESHIVGPLWSNARWFRVCVHVFLVKAWYFYTAFVCISYFISNPTHSIYINLLLRYTDTENIVLICVQLVRIASISFFYLQW